jgi:hypothetical protein
MCENSEAPEGFLGLCWPRSQHLPPSAAELKFLSENYTPPRHLIILAPLFHFGSLAVRLLYSEIGKRLIYDPFFDQNSHFYKKSLVFAHISRFPRPKEIIRRKSCGDKDFYSPHQLFWKIFAPNPAERAPEPAL